MNVEETIMFKLLDFCGRFGFSKYSFVIDGLFGFEITFYGTPSVKPTKVEIDALIDEVNSVMPTVKFSVYFETGSGTER